MGTIILIASVVLIALIVIIGASYKRKLHKLYQKQPYQSVTGSDLEAELKGGNAYKHYKTRQDRLTMLITALCAAVVIIGGLAYASVNWWNKAEQQDIEQQRLQKEAEQEVAALLPDDLPMVAGASRYSKQGLYVRFVEYKAHKMAEILTTQKRWEKAAAQFEAKASQPEKLELIAGKVRYDEYQKLYDDMLSEQKRDFDKVQKLSFADWIVNQSYIYEIILFVIFFGLCIRSYKKKSYQILLWSCLAAGIACLFGIWYWGLWLNIGFLVTCCLVLVGAGLLTLSGFINLKDVSDGYFIICLLVGLFLFMGGLLCFGAYCAGNAILLV